MPGAFLVLDPQLMIRAFSQEMANLTQIKRPEALGRCVFEVFPDNPNNPSGSETWKASLQNVLRTGVEDIMPVVKYSLNLPESAGGELADKYWQHTNTPVLDSDSRVLYIIHQTEEVTELKITVQKALAAESRMMYALSAAEMGVWELDLKTGQAFRSLRHDQCFGYQELQAEWSQAHALKHVHPDERKLVEQALLDAIEGRGDLDVECRITWPDGTLHWIKSKGHRELDAAGNPIRLAGIVWDITDLKQISAALKVNEQRFNQALDSAEMGTWQLNLADNSVIHSTQFRVIFDLDDSDDSANADQIINSRIHPADQDAVEKVLAEAIREKKHYSHEYRVVRKNGDIRWVASKGHPTFGEDGVPVSLSGVCYDISEQKQIQFEVLEKEREFKTLANTMPQLAWMANADGFIYWYNDNWYHYTGTIESDMTGWGWKSVHHPDYLEKVLTMWQDAIIKGHEFELEFPLRKSSGEFMWFLTRVRPLRDENNKITKWLGTNTDIDEQKRISINLKRSQDQLQSIINNISEGLVLAGPRGEMHLFNPAALKLHGFTSMDEILNTLDAYPNLFRLYTLEGTEIPLAEWPLSKVLRGDSFSEFEVEVERTDTGKKFYASYSGAPIKDQDGKVELGILTLRDVSYRIQTELDLKKAVSSRDDFLSIASHELKTPLTSLKLQIQSAARKLSKNSLTDFNPENMKVLFTKNTLQIDRLVRLVDDMLDLSRIQSGKLSYNLTYMNLRDLITDMVASFKEQFENAGCSLRLDKNEDLWGIFDRDRIEQVLTNLLTNALKYGDKKPVTVSACKQNKSALINIIDQGIGISPENYNKVFLRFERIISANEVSGLGIGLYISKQIIEAHNGKITVTSKLKHGSKFTVELPLRTL